MMLSDLREVYDATEGKDMSSSYVFLALENLFSSEKRSFCGQQCLSWSIDHY